MHRETRHTDWESYKTDRWADFRGLKSAYQDISIDNADQLTDNLYKIDRETYNTNE